MKGKIAQDAFNRTADSINMAGVPWIIPGWLARDEVHILAGAAKTGKSQLAITLAALITNGGKWYDTDEAIDAGRVAYYSTEEDTKKVLLPRFNAAGGDVSRIHFGTGVLDAAASLDDLYKSLMHSGFNEPLRLIVIDGVTSAIANINDNSEVRKYLTTVKQLAERTSSAIMLITHTAKGAESKYTKAQDFILGAQAWVAVPRMAWVMVRDKQVDKKAALLVRMGNLPCPMNGAVRLYGGEFESLGEDEQGLEIKASKITKHEMLEGDPDDLFMAAISADKDTVPDGNGMVEDDILAFIAEHGAETGGYVRNKDIRDKGFLSGKGTTALLNKMCAEGKIRFQHGINDSAPKTKWWGLADAPMPLGNGLDTADWGDGDAA